MPELQASQGQGVSCPRLPSPAARSVALLIWASQCDEGSPECRRCLSFGVCCNYDARIPDFLPRHEISRQLNGKMQTYRALVMDLTPAEESRLEFTEGSLSRLQRFQIRTAMSIGPPELSRLFENEVFRMNFMVSLLAFSCFGRNADMLVSGFPSTRF